MGEDAFVDVMGFEEGGNVLFELIVDVEGNFKYFSDIANHVDGSDFYESALVEIIV